MNEEAWSSVDDYLAASLQVMDPELEASLEANAEAGLPAIDVSPMLGKFLYLLARIQGASRILEIGTLGGFSTICLARALPAGGQLVTLELDASHAAVARSNISRAGLAGRVQLIEGPAMQSLARLHHDGSAPFDLIFVDADKTGYPGYLAWALKLSRPGTVIVADNIVRRGMVADPNCEDENVRAVRSFIELVAAEPSLSGSATVLQTVGKKGYDGFLIARVAS